MITAWIGSVAFLLPVILYVLLVLGFPYGEFAMGGQHKVMPKRMRVVCAISIFVQVFAILTLLQTGNVIFIGLPQGISKGLCYFFAIFITLNTIANAVSKSKKEKIVITPFSLVVTICFWFTAING